MGPRCNTRDIGTTVAGQKVGIPISSEWEFNCVLQGPDDNMTLKEAKFAIGDYLDVSINSPSGRMDRSPLATFFWPITIPLFAGSTGLETGGPAGEVSETGQEVSETGREGLATGGQEVSGIGGTGSGTGGGEGLAWTGLEMGSGDFKYYSVLLLLSTFRLRW